MPPVIPAEQELQLNPVTGEMEAVPVVPVTSTSDNQSPERSWDRDDERPNSYNAEFEYKGATIFIKALSKKQRKALKKEEKANSAQVKKLLAKKKTLEASIKALTQQQAGLTEEAQIEALDDQIETIENQSEAIDDQMEQLQMAFFEGVVALTVRGWINGPKPYSSEAVAKLPLEMLVEWSLIILEKSVLGKTEAEILKNNSSAS